MNMKLNIQNLIFFNKHFKINYNLNIKLFSIKKAQLMNQLRAPTDNSIMLEKINNAKMENIFQQSNISIDQIPKGDYSPEKEQIKKELSDIGKSLKQINKNKPNFSKWDSFAPYSFYKLSHQQKDHIFQTLFQDFISMKVQHNQYVQKYLKLHAQLQRLQNQIVKFRKRGLTAEQKVQIYRQQNQQNKQHKQQIQRLHQKILALTSSKPVQNKTKSANNNKTFNVQKTIFPLNQNIKAELEIQKRHVKQLLQIVDQLKRNKNRLENDLKERNINESFENRNLKKGQRPGKNVHASNDNNFKQFTDELLMWKQKYHQKQLCYNQMKEDRDKVILQLKRQVLELKQDQRSKKNMQRVGNRKNFNTYGNQQRIKQLQDINSNLQNRIKTITQSPFLKENTSAIDIKKKTQQFQQQIKKLKIQLQNVKSQRSKYLSELQIKTREATSLKAQGEKMKKQLKQQMAKQFKSANNNNQLFKYDQNDYYRKLLHLVKIQGNDPVWKKYSDLAVPGFMVMTENQLRQTAQNLWKSKLQLLAHLQKAQVQLRTNKEMNDQKLNSYLKQKQYLGQELRMARARLDQWVSMDRVHGVKTQFQIYEHKGLKYNDSISVFEDTQDQVKALDHNENFFDLYLGQLNLDQVNILRHPQNKVKSASSIISFFTIDFYNHATQHSNFSQGISKKLLNNFSFKVEVNSYFIKFLSKNSIALQLWSPQGTSTVLFGKGQIWLSDLLSSTAKDVANVLKGKCPIYSPNKVLIATVQYRVRLRLPINSFLQLTNAKQNFNKNSKLNPFAINQRKKLAITIEKAEGLRSAGNTFVYFNIQNQDFFTEPELGSTPFWDYHRQIDIILDEQFSGYLKQNYVQFTLFDDDKEVNEDVIGIAKANLTQLLQSNQPLDLLLQVEDDNFQKIGKLKIKAYWA